MKRGAKASPRAPLNQYGQSMGAKGLQTRRRLMEATERLVSEVSLRDLSVAQIAKAAGTSTSTFYLYFQDVPEAVLAVISAVSQSTPEFLVQFAEPWPEREAYARAQHFVETYIDYFKVHLPVLRVRNHAADEGDERFIRARASAAAPLLEAMAMRMEERREAGDLLPDLHARSMAGALLAMIERIALVPQVTLGRGGVTRSRLVQSAAFFTAVALGGRASVGEIPPGG